MKKERGFTLVELMVVVSITVLLLTWGIPSFSTWKKKHDIENQMVQLYSDLQFGRMTAYGNKVISGVCWTAGNTFTNYQIKSDTNNDGTFATRIGAAVTAKYAITPSSTAQSSVSFDGRGFLNPNNSISFSVAASSGAAMDCVAVSSTRIILGKWDGAKCNAK